jgi:hypothetical protein
MIMSQVSMHTFADMDVMPLINKADSLQFRVRPTCTPNGISSTTL